MSVNETTAIEVTYPQCLIGTLRGMKYHLGSAYKYNKEKETKRDTKHTCTQLHRSLHNHVYLLYHYIPL